MRFVIMHETVTKHDAIGNDIELMYNVLCEKHSCVVYAKNRLNKNVDYIDEKKLDEFLRDTNTIVIYHHSVLWEHGYSKIKDFDGLVIFRYHNITPEYFFEGYNEHAYLQCKKGYEQTQIMQKANQQAFWLADSHYNANQLTLVKEQKSGVCAPFNKIEEWKKTTPDELILRDLIESNKLNVLFVGRVAPNKGHMKLLDVIRTYIANYDSDIVLRVIGKFDGGLKDYNEQIERKIKNSHIENNVQFIGEINDSTLMSYYLGSDVFLCLSEHEGFCVPIIEAQSFKLPVVALAETAVSETIGENQLGFGRDIRLYAAALRKIKKNPGFGRLLGNIGYKNYTDRFTYDKIKQRFSEEIERMTGVTI